MRGGAASLNVRRQWTIPFGIHILVPVQAAKATDRNAFAFWWLISGMLRMLRFVLCRQFRWCRLRGRRNRRRCPALRFAMRTRQRFLKINGLKRSWEPVVCLFRNPACPRHHVHVSIYRVPFRLESLTKRFQTGFIDVYRNTFSIFLFY